MKKIIFIVILILLFSLKQDTIRFRVIANSNSEYDTKMKYIVKDELYGYLKNSLQYSTSLEETRNILSNDLVNIDNKIGNILEKNNYNVNYNVNYGMNYFPKKVESNKTYDEGEYESLVVTLGDGLGDNFWCILFPPLCFMDEEDSNVEYKSFFKEIFDKLFK